MVRSVFIIFIIPYFEVGGKPNFYTHPEYCGGITEAAKALTTALEEREVDLARLTDYAQRLQNGAAVFKRLGYLAERVALPVGDHPAQWQAALTGGHAPLDPGRPGAGPVNTRWRVRVNVSKAEIQGWQEAVVAVVDFNCQPARGWC